MEPAATGPDRWGRGERGKDVEHAPEGLKSLLPVEVQDRPAGRGNTDVPACPFPRPDNCRVGGRELRPPAHDRVLPCGLPARCAS